MAKTFEPTLLLFLIAIHLHAQPQYKLVDLQSISGVGQSYANGINRAGTVVGRAYLPNGNQALAFQWQGGSMQILPLPQGYVQGLASAINDSGTICGAVYPTSLGSGSRAFKLRGSSYTILNALVTNGESYAWAINNHDDVVGESNAAHNRHATLWHSTTGVDLGTFGSDSLFSSAGAINDSAGIAGYGYVNLSDFHTFISEGSGLSDLGALPSNTSSRGYGMNIQRWIVGQSGLKAFVWKPGLGMTALPAPTGSFSAGAYAVNDSGIIVGSVQVQNGPTYVEHAFLWRNGVFTDLNVVSVFPSGWVLTRATGINRAGQIVGYGSQTSSGFPRAILLNPIWANVTSPENNEVVQAGEPYNIRWDASGFDSLRIEFSVDSGATYQQVAGSVPASDGVYHWSVPDTLSAKCKIRLSDAGAPSSRRTNQILAESQTFKVKGYVLTRFKPNGDYEPFDPARHGWSFPNDTTHMWPASWWSQFDYASGLDPYTQRRYPRWFVSDRPRARKSDFTDWPLFVRTFGIDSCYRNVSQAVYSPFAVRLWTAIKHNSFTGSCHGFAVSSILAFEHQSEFQQKFPEVGSFQDLHDLPLDSLRRRVVNQLYDSQFGYLQIPIRLQLLQSKTPRQTLAQLKTSIPSDSSNHRPLFLWRYDGNSGHVVAPYQLKKGSAAGRWNLSIYDSNCPTSDCHGVVVIDSLSNSWQYDQTWGGSGKGLVLDNPAMDYIGPLLLWDPDRAGNRTLTGSYVRFFNSDVAITITDSIGETMGFHDSTAFNNFSDGGPIIIATGSYQHPIGYLVPSGAYSVQMSGFTDSLVRFSAFGTSQMLSYWRSDGVSSQSDLLSFKTGLDVSNRNPQTKLVNLESITRVLSDERVFQVLNCPAVQNDSMSVMTPDDSRLKFVNRGPQKTYDLNIELAGRNVSGSFVHAAISVPANSSHYIVPNWQDLQHQPVRIYQDIGNIGTIHDTLIVDNQATDVQGQSTPETPREFTLEQNYPNPFNPSTTIRYALPQTSYVTLTVYNTLGQQVSQLVNEQQQAGYFNVVFHGDGLASGVYFYRLRAGDHVATKKLLLLR